MYEHLEIVRPRLGECLATLVRRDTVLVHGLQEEDHLYSLPEFISLTFSEWKQRGGVLIHLSCFLLVISAPVCALNCLSNRVFHGIFMLIYYSD